MDQTYQKSKRSEPDHGEPEQAKGRSLIGLGNNHLETAPDWLRRHPRLRVALILGGLLLLALALSSCAYPGQDPPCVGVNKGMEGCNNPSQGIKDANNGGDWYIAWAFDIIRRFLSSVAINTVKVGVSIFWSIFTNLSSTDFASCTGGNTTPTCTAVSTFNAVRVLALVFFPLIFSWKFFKSYMIGSLVESVYESAFSFVPKIIMAGFVILYLDVLISGAFGMSNLLFMSILGGPKSLNDLSEAIVGSQDCKDPGNGGPVICTVSGVQTIQAVQDVGLVALVTVICLLVALVFVLLGLCFFLRTIIVFILFCLSPLAVVAGTTEELRYWFGRWMEGVQAMLIAPIPVAICLSLTINFLGSSVIPGAHDDPAGFILVFIYIVSFLAIGALMMFKIAGQTGGLMFGMAVAGVSALGGYAAGSMNRNRNSKTSSHNEQDHPGETPSLEASARSFSAPTSSNRIASAAPNSRGSTPASALDGAAFSQQQVQTELLSTLRALNANNAAAMIVSSRNASSASYSSLGSGDMGGNGYYQSTPGFSYQTHHNLQNIGHWAGYQAGVSGPHVSFAPHPPPYRGSGAGSGEVRAETNSYHSFDMLFSPGPGNAGGKPGADNPTTGGPGNNDSGSGGTGVEWAEERYGDRGVTSPEGVTGPVRPIELPAPLASPAPARPAPLPPPATGAGQMYFDTTPNPAPNPGYAAVRAGLQAGDSYQYQVANAKNPVTNPFGRSRTAIPSIASLKKAE